MKNWKHLSFDQRKIINSLLCKNSKLKEIAMILDFDPTSISKEIRRNRFLNQHHSSNKAKTTCKKLIRFPYVCNGCRLRYGNTCPFDKFKYDPKFADTKAKENLVLSRRGLDIDSNDFKALDDAIKQGVDQGHSIYHISKTDKRVSKSVTTIYRYIHSGYLKTKPLDLPSAVTYKKRKHHKKYDYSNNKIDRSNHTYLDYLSYRRSQPNEYGWQLDFLGAIKTDSKAILTLIAPEIHFTFLAIIKNPNSKKVIALFNALEECLGVEIFRSLFPYILTDRDPSFSDMEGLEYSPITKDKRTHVFYCDPYVSNHKPNVENMNKQLRKFFPKGRSIDHYTKAEVRSINIKLIQSRVRSLGGATPEEAFIKVYGQDILNKLLK